MMLSNQMSRCICKCIRMRFISFSVYQKPFNIKLTWVVRGKMDAFHNYYIKSVFIHKQKLPIVVLYWQLNCIISLVSSETSVLYGPRREKTCLQGFANNTGADQPAHSHSLIGAFVIRVFEITISKLATSEYFSFLESLCS